jgi:hypothetical protein
MTLSAAVGQSQSPDGHQAGLEASQQALERLGKPRPAFAWVIASAVHPSQHVLAGVMDLLGDLPLLGFSTSAELTPAGRSKRSVVVGLFGGDNLNARSGWWPDFIQDSRSSTQNMLRTLLPDAGEGETLMVVADGLNGDANFLCETLSGAKYAVAGCLAGGDVGRGRTYQMGGRQVGSGGLAGMVFGGDVVIGTGAAHGWQPLGVLARLTRVQGQWVRGLDGEPASETYARWFGYPARDWAFPPLNDLVRMYPLGVQEQGDSSELVVRSPLRVEADGGLRMNSRLAEGKIVNLMIGSLDGCAQAALQATQEALAALGAATPRAALLLVDMAWQLMLEIQPQREVQAVREALGSDIPIFGGYTFGQIMRPSGSSPVQFLNQHIEVVLFGEKNSEAEEGGV